MLLTITLPIDPEQTSLDNGAKVMRRPRKPEAGQSLADANPDLAKQWHPTKNGGVTPYDVSVGSQVKAWWKCPKGDDHEWDAVISDRNRGIGCAICSNYKVVKSNSLATLNPELASEWHPTKNRDLTPDDVHPGSAKRVWWKCAKGDDHEWQTVVHSRSWGRGCPVCSGRKVVRSTCLAAINPELAKQWHPTENGKLTPYKVGPNSGKSVWWKCPNGDDHEWRAIVNNRNRGLGCPICSNQKVVLSNCLATLHPDLAEQWHPSKNGKLMPYDIGPGSGKLVWWKCPVGDDHVWRADVKRRSLGRGCPVCIGRKVVDSNSFLTLHPDLAKELHPTMNGNLDPNKYRPYSNKTVWWKCPRGDDHEWKTSFNMRVQGTGCPKCNSQKSAPELRVYCEIKTVFPATENRKRILGREVDIYVPELNLGVEYDGWYWHKNKSEMDKEKTRELEGEIALLRVREAGLEALSESDILLDTKELSFDSMKKIFRSILTNPLLKVPEYERAIEDYLQRDSWAAAYEFDKIQFERNGVVYERSISHLFPEIASQWHYEKNHPLVPDQFTASSRKRVWWKDRKGREWQADVLSRTRVVKARKEKNENQYDFF